MEWIGGNIMDDLMENLMSIYLNDVYEDGGMNIQMDVWMMAEWNGWIQWMSQRMDDLDKWVKEWMNEWNWKGKFEVKERMYE